MQKLRIALVALIAAAVCVSCGADEARFDNYRLYQLNVSTEAQSLELHQLEEQNRYEFWSLPKLHGLASIMVAPHQRADFADLVEGLQIESELTVENVQQ